jgi:hypothetical protein
MRKKSNQTLLLVDEKKESVFIDAKKLKFEAI